ncbi:amidohydrolase 2 (plasmid) [Deinococcus proteolyticus MRP]|uniref:Amidohydrolase 2 n=1 Tax=Deinococcus proteolyticus (strain ATCC 35074 / DSM 20540 / JCM 6276 / NBRC 101906 / NCIMB 13154 / VKM Ac-1939 / CCM 2703 / MRP) TaxID=693977 RepID=F0RQU4_DEIPM|nr:MULTISPECIES: amidohydrolase family protein [Deinococcus]ADY27653.1 amidohydrolase 2 [Deinococcus proteolyticus MRP]MCY1703531.1 amidohydrolase family protein [Deinococcus sp. SL84]
MSESKYTDTHAHLWPDAYLEGLEKLGAQGVDVAKGLGASDRPEDMQRRLKMMDDAGVQKQILSVTPQTPQYGNAEEALTLARMLNDTYAQVIKDYPGRFAAYGTVPLPHVEEAIAEARRCITELGFQGIAINTLTRGTDSVADDKLLPFYEALNDLGTVLYIHPTGCGANSPMVNDSGLEWVVGAPIEDTVATLQLLKADIPHQFPRITFHIAHLGGFLGTCMQRIEDNYTDWDAFPRSPWESLRAFWFDTANFHAPALRAMIETFGPVNIVLGSDFPYFQGDKYTRAVTYIKDTKLAADVTDDILWRNAERLYQGGK